MWQYLWVTGSDFDGNESDRLVAGGFVALDVIQAGKVFKLAKVKVLSKGGRVVNITNRTVLKTIAKESLKDMTIDICCQFTVNLIRNVALSYDIKSRLDFNNCVVKAFEGIDFKGAAKDAIFTATNKGNEKITTALVCAMEIMTKLQDDGVNFASLTDGGINCLLEVPSAFIKQYKPKKSNHEITANQFNNALVYFKSYLDDDGYKIIEGIIKELPKQ